MADNGQQIIIKRIKKGKHAHHGGAWKIAYADFVTAMMAFFLLLWLLSSATEDQLEGVSSYFTPSTISSSSSGAGGMLGGKVIDKGSSASSSGSPSVTPTLPPPSVGDGGSQITDPNENVASSQSSSITPSQESGKVIQDSFSVPEFKSYQDNITLVETEKGLEVHITDSKNRPMFRTGTAILTSHANIILNTVAKALEQTTQKISVNGHTSSRDIPNASNLDAWELSSERALAAQRSLQAFGLNPTKVSHITSYGINKPSIPGDLSSTANQRISILVLEEKRKDTLPLPSVLQKN